MELVDAVLGRPLATTEQHGQKIGPFAGVPVLGLDGLASAAYGPEAALAVLIPVGVAGLAYMWPIIGAILLLLAALYFSYRQTIEAYPNGGGSYTVARQNLGTNLGLLAAASLLLDYILNVAVAISAGIAALVSAVPLLYPYMLWLCLGTLLVITLVNLRGIRESSLAFGVPTYLFVLTLLGVVAVGLYRTLVNGGHAAPVVAPPAVPAAVTSASIWLLLRSFASGCTAMTGVEAVSNGVPLFSKPTVQNAQRTLTLIVVILALLLGGVATLSHGYYIAAMDEEKPGYQSVLSQLIAAVAGRGIVYHVTIGSVIAVLMLSANTSFADFPRLCRLLAEDGFLPAAFANLGRRLVYSIGISILAIISALILIGFGGITDRLIPLFAVGAFSAFTLSQAGMVMHWHRSSVRKHRLTKITVNAIGAITTGLALLIIIAAKFIEGAWVTLIIVPGMVAIFKVVGRHYRRMAREVADSEPLKTGKVRPLAVIVPIDGWNKVTERALRFALDISSDITAVHVTSKSDDKRLRKRWCEMVEEPARAAKYEPPRLEIIQSPYRQLFQPILDFVDKIKQEKPGRLIAVVVPEVVQPRWWEYLLHNHRAMGLKAALFLKGDERTVVINTPWYMRDV
ncbi:MAG: APC family permease [Verrucomicrobia bacterium]|nr:APC family permease [Verrucomicrobiota bacterium]